MRGILAAHACKRRKSMKRTIVVLLAVMMLLSLVACGEGKPEATLESSSPALESTEANASAVEPVGLTEAFAEYPILITSGGQSADFQMVGTVLKKQNMDFFSNGVATSAEIRDNKTLIIVVGGSSKGLGAAGIDANGELARLEELINAAKTAGLSIIAMHTGGVVRRGELSDKFIAPVFENADYAIVVKDGDQDGLMASICSKSGIPCDYIDSISDVVTVLPAAFK
jgi:hypothetical protein